MQPVTSSTTYFMICALRFLLLRKAPKSPVEN